MEIFFLMPETAQKCKNNNLGKIILLHSLLHLNWPILDVSVKGEI